jgi:hypothetical protein
MIKCNNNFIQVIAHYTTTVEIDYIKSLTYTVTTVGKFQYEISKKVGSIRTRRDIVLSRWRNPKLVWHNLSKTIELRLN